MHQTLSVRNNGLKNKNNTASTLSRINPIQEIETLEISNSVLAKTEGITQQHRPHSADQTESVRA